MTETYKTFGLDINVEDKNLLNQELKNRLKNQVWEKKEVDALSHISKDACVLELGACIGIVASVLNKQLTDPTKQVSLEPNPKLIEQLTRVRNDNNCQFHIVNSFIDTEIHHQKFSLHPNHVMGGELGEIKDWEVVNIESSTIESLEKRFGLTFDTLVMDIEKAEYPLWNKGFFTDQHISNIKTMMIEFHWNTRRNKLREHLKSMFEETIVSEGGNIVGVYKR